MRISLLLEREPFGEILERTLERFLPSLTGCPHTVTWYPRNPGVGALGRLGQQPWLVNTYLNAIFAPSAEPETLAPVVQEFARSTRWWRRPLQHAYVTLASRSPTSSVLAQAALGIAPPLPEPEARLIVGGNHKIRLLDHRRKRAYGLIKDGLTDGFMARELRARRTAEQAGIPVPRLEEIADDGTWFSESYVNGIPVNRLADGPLWAQEHDARITRIGRLLRRLHLDEVPQAVNLLRGEMSLVGPRPERPEFVAELEQHIPFYRTRHAVRPGVTGWAQVNYPYGSSVEDALKKLEYELYYIKHCSPFLDALIVARTVGLVLTLRGR